MQIESRVYPGLEPLSRDAADFIVGAAREAIDQRGLFTMAISGGKSPKRLYELLGEKNYASQIRWNATHLFWADERAVPPSHSASNFGMTQNMLSQVPISSANIHRMHGERDPLSEAAVDYENAIRLTVPPAAAGGTPAFDLVLLGLGADGHTASLFPGDPLLEEQTRLVAAVQKPVGRPPVPRITLTLPCLNQARTALFLVGGAGKKDLVDEILQDREGAARKYPAARVAAQERTLWFVSEG